MLERIVETVDQPEAGTERKKRTGLGRLSDMLQNMATRTESLDVRTSEFKERVQEKAQQIGSNAIDTLRDAGYITIGAVMIGAESIKDNVIGVAESTKDGLIRAKEATTDKFGELKAKTTDRVEAFKDSTAERITHFKEMIADRKNQALKNKEARIAHRHEQKDRFREKGEMTANRLRNTGKLALDLSYLDESRISDYLIPATPGEK